MCDDVSVNGLLRDDDDVEEEVHALQSALRECVEALMSAKRHLGRQGCWIDSIEPAIKRAKEFLPD